jgi:hypothetical protein
MTTPAKPKQTRQNQPINFSEAMAPTFSPSNSVAATAPRLSARQSRFVLAGIWLIATILGGIGIGRLIVGSATVMPQAARGIPVAKAVVNVASTPDLTVISQPDSTASASQPQALAVTPALAVTQAQAGIPFETAAGLLYQSTSDVLQPGFTQYGRLQGNIGTAAVR